VLQFIYCYDECHDAECHWAPSSLPFHIYGFKSVKGKGSKAVEVLGVRSGYCKEAKLERSRHGTLTKGEGSLQVISFNLQLFLLKAFLARKCNTQQKYFDNGKRSSFLL
jgi:hypothetical protein